MQKKEGSVCRNLGRPAPRQRGQDARNGGQLGWNKQVIAPKAVDFEKNKKHIYEEVVVFEKENELERPVAALLRGGNGYYSLEREKWSKYMNKLRDLI